MIQTVGQSGALGGTHALDYTVVDGEGAEQPVGSATWADWDQRGRLVVARDGQIGVSVEGAFHVLEDFNNQTIPPTVAPGIEA